MRQRLEDVRAYRRLARPTPHDREQVGQLSQVVELGELPYLGAHARPRRRPGTSDGPWTANATMIADANATTSPSGNSRVRIRKNEANANNPSSRPPRTPTAASGPWIRCAKPARTHPYSGNGASSPASLAPSTGATAVSRITKPVATTIRAGMSHRGNTTGAADRVLCSGIKKSETTSTKMTTTKEARAGRKKEAQHNRHCGIGRGRHAEAPGPSLALCRPRISQAKRRLRHRARHDARRRAGGKAWTWAQRQEERDRARRERDPDQPAADGGAPPASGEACRAHEQRREHQLESESSCWVQGLRGVVSMPASRSTLRTAAATWPAPLVSPCTQMVS